YDFQTVVTHELGHALGLGHSTDSTSVMYATLTTGTVNRGLTPADLNVPDADTTGACGLHAAASGAVPTVATVPAVTARDTLFAPAGNAAAAREPSGVAGVPSPASRDAVFALLAEGPLQSPGQPWVDLLPGASLTPLFDRDTADDLALTTFG